MNEARVLVLVVALLCSLTSALTLPIYMGTSYE